MIGIPGLRKCDPRRAHLLTKRSSDRTGARDALGMDVAYYKRNVSPVHCAKLSAVSGRRPGEQIHIDRRLVLGELAFSKSDRALASASVGEHPAQEKEGSRIRISA